MLMEGPLPGSLSRASCVILYSRMLPSSSVNVRWEIPRGLLKKKLLCVCMRVDSPTCTQVSVVVHIWRAEDNLLDSILFQTGSRLLLHRAG